MKLYSHAWRALCGSKLWSQPCVVFKHLPPWISIICFQLTVPTCRSRELQYTSNQRWDLHARAVSWPAAGLGAGRDLGRMAVSECKPWQRRHHPDGDSKATAQCHCGRQLDTSPSLAQPLGPGPPPAHEGPALLPALGDTHCRGCGCWPREDLICFP